MKTACLLVALAAGAPALAAPDATVWTVRSRLFMRLDPAAQADPDGSAEPGALGQLRLVARTPWGEGPDRPLEVEAAAWLGRAPGAIPWADDAVAGDVTTLRLRAGLGAAWVEAGRHWTTVGAQRLTRLTGVTAGVPVAPGVEVAGRIGLSGEEPHEFVGTDLEFGGHARFAPTRPLRLGLGVLATSPEDGPARTRWTGTADWIGGDDLEGRAAVTADVTARRVVEARAEVLSRPVESLSLRGYGRYAEIDQLLPFGDLLAVFAPDPRGELGSLAEWTLSTRWRLRLDGAWVGLREAHAGGRWRAGVDVFPRAGARLIGEVTATTGPEERTGLLRLAGRWPLQGSVFATVEALGDAREDALGGVTRAGAGFEPWHGWFAYGAVEVARTPRWPERLAGLVLVEHALGAPVRWGGAP